MRDIFLLDMDDTLLDFPRAERAALKSCFEACGVRSDDYALTRFHEINDGLWKALERGETTRERLVYERFELLFQELGIVRDAHTAAERYFEELASVCFPFDGVHAFLKELKARGRIYIVTNGSEKIQHRHLRDSGVGAYADGVFISEEIGFYKPSPAYCAYVKNAIQGYSGERAVYIGDSLTADKPCAVWLGARFLRFLPRGEGEGYRSYREILQALD